MKPIFDDNGLATEPGETRCFYYDAITGEYTGWSDEYIHIGVSMPGDSTDIDPGEFVEGMIAVFTGNIWEYHEDHRGQTVYSTTNHRASVVDYIGTIKAGFVTIAPVTPYDTWSGTEWVTNTAAQNAALVELAEAEKLSLLAVATDALFPLQDAVDLGIATEEEKTQLLAWKTYRVMVNRVDTSKPVWPEMPQ